MSEQFFPTAPHNPFQHFRQFYLLLFNLILFSQGTALFSQNFKTVLGPSRKVEYPSYTWDGQPLNTGKYVQVSGTNAYTGLASGILLNRLLPDGHEELSVLIGDKTNQYSYEPRTIEHNQASTPGDVLLYIGGLRKTLTGRPAAFLIPTTGTGELRSGGGYLQGPLGASQSETVMAVERLSGGDVVAVGTTETQAALSSTRNTFFAARFNSTLSTGKWSFRYAVPYRSNLNYTVHEACTGKILTGSAMTETEVLVLTGSAYATSTPTKKHTFACCIDASNGNVLWTTEISSALVSDEGLDIVQNVGTREFLIVGYAVDSDPDKTRRMWVCKLGPNGNFLGGSTFSLLDGNDLNFVARDVCLSINTNGYVTTGYRELTNPDSTRRQVTFVMEISPAAPFTPIWAQWYDKSDPSIDADESIHVVSNSGYFVTTGSRAMLPDRYDAFALQISGREVPTGSNCPGTDFSPDTKLRGSATAGVDFRQTATYWSLVPMASPTPVDPEEDWCGPGPIPVRVHRALALSWTGYFDTPVSFSTFLKQAHTVAFRFMPQFAQAYDGPVLAENGSGNYFIGQSDYTNGAYPKTRLRIAIGSKTEVYEVQLLDSVWYHMALSCKPERDLNTGAVTLVFTPYLNGKQLAPNLRVSPDDSQLPMKSFLRLGKRTNGVETDNEDAQFYGLIDDVVIFNKVISPSELIALLKNTDIAALDDPGLQSARIAVFDFNESTTLPALHGAATIVDISADKSNATDNLQLPLPTAHAIMTLPFPPGEAWKVIQGVDSFGLNPSHIGRSSFCWDFEVNGYEHYNPYPMGTNGAPAYAAASGIVSSVIDNYAPLSLISNNIIEIQTGPKEYYGYMHGLQGTAMYKTGDFVQSGLPLVLTGNVCKGPKACGYHLHMGVTNMPNGSSNFVSIPIAFSNYEVYNPETAAWEFVARGMPAGGAIIRNPPIPDLPYRFVAVWEQTNVGEYQAFGCTKADLIKAYNGMWADGWRLTQLQSHDDDGELVYTAVWKQTNAAERNAFGMTLDAFKAFYNAIWADGWRIALMDVCVIDGEPRYSAVWHKTKAAEFQVYGDSYPVFRAKYDKMWASGWRLKSINVYVIDGQFYYTAVWNMMPDAGEYQVYALDYASFKKRYDELWADGWRLALIDIAVENGTPYYTAVWHNTGAAEIQVYEWDYKDFKNRYNHLWKDGWRLKLLDVWSGKGFDEGRPDARNSITPDRSAGPFSASLFPNPSGKGDRTRLRIELPENQPIRVNTWDMTGKLRWTFEDSMPQGGADLEIPSDTLIPGVYLLEITTPSGRKTIKWLVTNTN
ncbi:MAG: T9SS type A sorting domain-containing protein [Lewinellaceae bacterium]|nr:T9SS type A sorting domain-containing protein [Lewinellaceae bacterium]